MQIQALALPGKWPGRSASGFAAEFTEDSAASKPSERSCDASASRPMPLAVVARKRRRSGNVMACPFFPVAGGPRRGTLEPQSGNPELLRTARYRPRAIPEKKGFAPPAGTCHPVEAHK